MIKAVSANCFPTSTQFCNVGSEAKGFRNLVSFCNAMQCKIVPRKSNLNITFCHENNAYL